MLATGYFLKIAKIINSEQKKNNLSLSQKLVPTKHKKWPIRQHKLPQKFRATRQIFCGNVFQHLFVSLTSFRNSSKMMKRTQKFVNAQEARSFFLHRFIPINIKFKYFDHSLLLYKCLFFWNIFLTFQITVNRFLKYFHLFFPTFIRNSFHNLQKLVFFFTTTLA